MVLNFLPKKNTPGEISNPLPIIYAHSSIEGFEVGVLLGALAGYIGHLYKRFIKKEKSDDKCWKRTFNLMQYGALSAGIVGAAICFYRTTISKELGGLERN